MLVTPGGFEFDIHHHLDGDNINHMDHNQFNEESEEEDSLEREKIKAQ